MDIDPSDFATGLPVSAPGRAEQSGEWLAGENLRKNRTFEMLITTSFGHVSDDITGHPQMLT